jgi:tetratricopeptide (TPR) repeat protein
MTISARTGIADALRDSEKSTLRTLALDAAAQVQNEVAALGALKLDAVTMDLLVAGLYAEVRLVDEAITRYERVVALQPTAVVYNTLGDCYRAVDLQRYAFLSYQQALELLDYGEDDPGVRAAAEFGKGQVERSRMNFAEAAAHFARALEIYSQIGAQAELQASQKALDETREHL